MAKLNKKLKIGLVVLALIAIGVLLVGGQPFAISGQPVGYLVPKFGSAQCVPAGDATIERSAPVEQAVWTCGIRSDSQYNIPQDVDTCNLQVTYRKTGTAFYKGLDIQRCDLGGSNCQKISIIPQNTQINNPTSIGTISVNQEIRTKGIVGTLYENYKSGDATIKMTATKWGIEIINVDGFRQFVEGCNAESLRRDFLLQKDIDKISGNRLGRNQVLNWIGGATPLYDVADVISGSIVGFNGEIYVVAPKQYYKVSPDATATGLRIVDTSQIFTSDKIQCRPSQNTLCNPDATLKKTITDPSGSTCSPTRGIAPGWFTPATDTTKVCKQTCTDGKIALTGCKTIPVCKSGEVLNTNYDCVTGGTREGTELQCLKDEIQISSTTCVSKLSVFLVIVALILIAVIITVIVLLSGNTGGRR